MCLISVLSDLQVTGQSATDEEDFVSDFSSVIIPTGAIFTTLSITILNDNIKEDNETFLVGITDVTFPGSLCEHTATAQVTILSNDQGNYFNVTVTLDCLYWRELQYVPTVFIFP